MARTLAKIPSDILDRITYTTSAEKAVMVWIAIEASVCGVVEVSTTRVAQSTGVRKNRVRDAIKSLAEKKVLILADNYKEAFGGFILWSEKTCWSLYFGNHSVAQWRAVSRQWLTFSHHFTAIQLPQLLEQQWGFSPLLNEQEQSTNYNNKNNRQKKNPSGSSALGGRKPSDETEEEAFNRKKAKILEDKCLADGGSGRAPE